MFPSNLNTPDFNPVIIRKKQENTARPSSGYKGSGISTSVKIEKQADEGNFAVKKYETSFIQQVVAYRSKLGLKQEEFAKRYNLPVADIKAFEKNTPPYNPNLVSRLKTILSKN